MHLDHENLDVYKTSVDFAAWAYALCKGLTGNNRFARDQLLRASQSIALNIAEGCGKAPAGERGRFFQIASGSARECAAVLDILERCGAVSPDHTKTGKALLVRIVAMLTRMIEGLRQVREDGAVYVYGNENANEQKSAESP
jgi:four helix bundle protein